MSGTSAATPSMTGYRPAAPQALAVSAALGVAAYAAAPEHLIEPKVLIVDGSLSRTAATSLTMAARRYDTFWHTGDGRYAKAALSLPTRAEGELRGATFAQA